MGEDPSSSSRELSSAALRSGIRAIRKELRTLTGTALCEPQFFDPQSELAAIRRTIREAKNDLHRKCSPPDTSSLVEQDTVHVEENFAPVEDVHVVEEPVYVERKLPSTQRRWTPPKRAMPAPPLLELGKARATLSTHRLGKTGRHFVCCATLGPKGGPSKVAEAEEERCKRVKRANEAWTAIRQTKRNRRHKSGQALQIINCGDHGPSITQSPTFPVKANNEEKRPQNGRHKDVLTYTSGCKLCKDRCWYGCECKCHDGVNVDASHSESTGDDQSVVTNSSADEINSATTRLEDALPHKFVEFVAKKSATNQRRRLLPPFWLRQLLGREDAEEDFEITLSAFECALRRPRGELDQDENGRVATFLRNARKQVGSAKNWFEGSERRDDKSSALEGVGSWETLERVVHRTLLAPRSIASRIRRILDARKERIADLFYRACEKQDTQQVFATVLGATVAPCLGVLVEEFVGPVVVVQAAQAPAQKSCGCAEVCWYGCKCHCHDIKRQVARNETRDVVEIEASQAAPCPLKLGERVEVRPLGVSAAYFAGVVACIDDENEEFDIYYDDNRYECGVALARLRPCQKALNDDNEEAADDKVLQDIRVIPSVRKKAALPTRKTNDEMVRPRAVRGGVVEWRRPTKQKEENSVEDENVGEVEISERAIAPRRDIGVYAWSTVDRGLLPAPSNAAVPDNNEDIPDTPISLQAALRPHVPGITYVDPSTPPLRPNDAHLDANNFAEPALYDPNWEALMPRPPSAIFVEKKSTIEPRAALALARHRRNNAGPGVYEIERADGVNSRHSRTTGCSIAPRARHSARPRPDELMEKVEVMRKQARRKRRAAILAKRKLRRSEAEERRMFRKWRRSKLTTEELKYASSSSSDERSQAERKELAAEMSSSGSDTETGPPQPRVPFTAYMRPEAVPTELAARKKAESALCAAKRGPSAYEVERSLAAVEPKSAIGGATFGAEADARVRNPNTRAAILIGIKRASEQAAATAREKLLAPQLHHAWVSPREQQPAHLTNEAAYRRSHVRSSKAVFTYTEEAETPDRLRAKRAIDMAAQTARDESFGGILFSGDDACAVDLSVGLGRDSIEILRKDAVRISHFGSPTIHKSIHAPRSPMNNDVEAANRALDPAERASVAAFLTPAREEVVGPHGERPTAVVQSDERQGDILLLSPHLRVEQNGHTFSKADRFAAEKSCDGGEALDLKPKMDSPVEGHRFLRFSNQLNDRNDEVPSAARNDESELWLSPRHIEKSVKTTVFGRADRFSFEKVDEPKLVLSPKSYVGRRRDDRGVLDYSRQSERWAATTQEFCKDDLKEAQSGWISAELERAPKIIEASLAAKGGLQFAVSTSHRQGPIITSGKEKMTTKAFSQEGDVLDLDTRGKPNSTAGVDLDWSRKSERWVDGISQKSSGDILKLEPNRSEEVRGYVDWGRTRHQPRKTASPKYDENINPTEATLSASYRIPNVVNMEKQQQRGKVLHSSLHDGDILKLSPARAHAKTERSLRSVRFPPHLLAARDGGHNDVWSLESPHQPPTAAVDTRERVLRGDGEHLNVAISRLKLAVGSASNILREGN